MPWRARQWSSAGDPLGPRSRGIADSQTAGMPPAGCPAALTAPVEMIQAPGWPGTLAVNVIVVGSAAVTFACAAAIEAVVRLGGRRCGRIHSGVTSWTTAKMA